MKRIAIAAAAALTLVSPLAATNAAADSRYDHDRGRGNDHRDNDRYQRDRNGHHQWRRGERLGQYEREHFRQVDWRSARLREPPRGYHYVRDDNSGEYLLVGIATGAILGIILANQ